MKQSGKFTKTVLPPEFEGVLGPQYIILNTTLDKEVCTLTEMAKMGLIDSNIADSQINSYLPCAAWDGNFKYTHMLKLSPQDTPAEATLPDLGKYIRIALSNFDGFKNQISAFILQCIPCFKKTDRSVKLNTPCSPVKLNIVMGTLLGLYQSATKRPQFKFKVHFYKQIHRTLTSTEEVQITFLNDIQNLVKLSFVEYISRIVPKYFPSEYVFIKTLYDNLFFWERIPLLCDDLRSICTTFQEADAFARNILDKITRVKHKAYKAGIQIQQNFTHEDVIRALQCPLLFNPVKDDFEILSKCYNTPSSLIQHLHKAIQIGIMPSEMQLCQHNYPYIYKNFSHLEWYSKTTWHICIYCLLKKKKLKTELKLDTVNNNIVCSLCLSSSVIKINFLGKFVNILNKNYIFCPICFEVHENNGIMFPGSSVCSCMIDKQIKPWPLPCNNKKMSCSCVVVRQEKRAQECAVCYENNNLHLVQRIDPCSGVLHTVCFCSKHKPNNQVLGQCYNISHIWRFVKCKEF